VVFRINRFVVTRFLITGILAATGVSAQHPDEVLTPPLRDWKAASSWAPSPTLNLDSKSGRVAAAATATPSPLTFVAITPCRLLDTRASSGFPGAFGGPSLLGDPSQRGLLTRKIPIPTSTCGIPAAAAYSLYLVAISPPGVPVGWLAAWPDDQPWPGTVVLNVPNGGISGNSAIIAAGAGGGIQVSATDPTDLVIDINGYYISQATAQFKGPWNRNTIYAPNDVVTFAGSSSTTTSYIGVSASQGVEPDIDAAAGATRWAVLAQGGQRGPQGDRGPAGAPGQSGPAGATGAQGPPIAFRGDWNIAATYSAGDGVFFNGSSYVSLSSGNIGTTPTNGAPCAPVEPVGPAGP
jgi:hypothetical protein